MKISNTKNRILGRRIVAMLLVLCTVFPCFNMMNAGVVADTPLATDSNLLAGVPSTNVISADGKSMTLKWISEDDRQAASESTPLGDFYINNNSDIFASGGGHMNRPRIGMKNAEGENISLTVGVQADKGYLLKYGITDDKSTFKTHEGTGGETPYDANNQRVSTLYFTIETEDGSNRASVYFRYSSSGSAGAKLEYLADKECYKISGVTKSTGEGISVRATEYIPFDLSKSSVYIGCNEYDRYFIQTGNTVDDIAQTKIVSKDASINGTNGENNGKIFEYDFDGNGTIEEDEKYRNVYETNTFYGKDYNGYIIEGPHASGFVSKNSEGVPTGNYGNKYLVYQSSSDQTYNNITIFGNSDEVAGVVDLAPKDIPTYDVTLSNIDCEKVFEVSATNKNRSYKKGEDTAINNNRGHHKSEYCAGIVIPTGGFYGENSENKRLKRHVVINLEGENKIGKLHWATNYQNDKTTRDNYSTLLIKSATDGTNGILEANYRQETTYSNDLYYYSWSAAIGGNNSYKDVTNIYIQSGTVLASAFGDKFDGWGNSGVGGDVAIGGGPNGIGEVTILGGAVYARSKSTGATIGGGGGHTGIGADGTVNIKGGVIYSHNEGIGVAIGAGSSLQANGNDATVIISGGDIYADTMVSNTAIGGGYSESMQGGNGNIDISGGHITSPKGIGGGSTDNLILYISGDNYVKGETDEGTKEGSGEVAIGGDADVAISGGTICVLSIGGGLSKANGYESADIEITGGSINSMMTVVPRRGDIALYRNLITVFDTNSEIEPYKAITSVSFATDTNENKYGTNDVSSDENGLLYFYLPTNDLLISGKCGSVDYTASTLGNNNYFLMQGDISNVDYCTVAFPYEPRVSVSIDNVEFGSGIKILKTGTEFTFDLDVQSGFYARVYYADYTKEEFVVLEPKSVSNGVYTYSLVANNNTDILYATYELVDEVYKNNRISIDLRYYSAFIQSDRVIIGSYEYINDFQTMNVPMEYFVTSGGIPTDNHIEVGRSCNMYIDKITIKSQGAAFKVKDNSTVNLTTLAVFDNSMSSDMDTAVYVERGSSLHFNIVGQEHSLRLTSESENRLPGISGDGNIFIDTVDQSYFKITEKNNPNQSDSEYIQIKGASLTVDRHVDTATAKDDLYTFTPAVGTLMGYLKETFKPGGTTVDTCELVSRDDESKGRKFTAFIIEFEVPLGTVIDRNAPNADVSFYTNGDGDFVIKPDEGLHNRGVVRRYLTENRSDETLVNDQHYVYPANGDNSTIIYKENCKGLLIVTLAIDGQISYSIDGTTDFLYADVYYTFPEVIGYSRGKNAIVEYSVNGGAWSNVRPKEKEAGDYTVKARLTIEGSTSLEIEYTVKIWPAINEWTVDIRCPGVPSGTSPSAFAESMYLKDLIQYEYIELSKAHEAEDPTKWQPLSKDVKLTAGRYLVRAVNPGDNKNVVLPITSGIIPLLISDEFVAVVDKRVFEKYVEGGASTGMNVEGTGEFSIYYSFSYNSHSSEPVKFLFNAGLPSGTKLTLIDFTDINENGCPGIYYYDVHTKTNISSLSLNDFIKMGDNSEKLNNNFPADNSNLKRVEYQLCVDFAHKAATAWSKFEISMVEEGYEDTPLASIVNITRVGTGIYGGELGIGNQESGYQFINEGSNMLSMTFGVRNRLQDADHADVDLVSGSNNVLVIRLVTQYGDDPNQGGSYVLPIGAKITLTAIKSGKVIEPLEVRGFVAFFDEIEEADYRVDVSGLPTGRYGFRIWLCGKPKTDNEEVINRYPIAYSYSESYSSSFLKPSTDDNASNPNDPYAGDFAPTGINHQVNYEDYRLKLDRTGDDANVRVINVANGNKNITFDLFPRKLDAINDKETDSMVVPVGGTDDNRLEVVLLDSDGNEVDVGNYSVDWEYGTYTDTTNKVENINKVTMTLNQVLAKDGEIGSNYMIKATLFVKGKQVADASHKIIVTKGTIIQS